MIKIRVSYEFSGSKLTTIVIVTIRYIHMKVLEYVKSNICTIGMIVGIILIGTLFLLPLEEHW